MRLILLILAVVVSWTTHATEPALYGQRIVVETNTAATAELARWLGQMTGAKFTVTNDVSGGGIVLVRTNSTLAAAADVERLKGKGNEAFVIRAEGDAKLWIVGTTDLAIEHGVYYFLDKLGCRWYLPNDHWTIIPQRSSIGLSIDRVEAPAFRMRSLAATGGFGKGLPVDPKGEIQARWTMWKTRNGLNGEFSMSGHAGEAFNTAHKAELVAHPEYLAEINGKREWAYTGKPCVSNPDMVKLYVADRLALAKRGTVYVSVEPADGGGYCTCEKCQKLGPVSNQVYFLANAVAKALAAEYPGTYASLYAYWEHAGVPTIDLETNVYVAVVPYGLQRTGLTGEELLLEWEKKVPRLGVYDYWVLPDWSSDLPDLSFRDTVPAKIRFWHAHHVDSFMGQTGNGAGAMGIVAYVASRLLWNPATDEKALLDEFYEKSFGAAAPPMRRMFNRWNDGFMLTGNELAYSFRDIQEARSLAKDEAVRARVNDFALYVQYLRLWTEFRGGGKDHKEATAALYNYLWRTYDSAMLSTFRLQQWFFFTFEKGAQWIADEWPLKDPSAPVWAALKPVTDAEIDELVASGVKAFVPVEYDHHTYSTKLVPLVTPAPTLKADGAWTTTPRMMGGQSYDFWATQGMTQVELQISCGPRRASHEALFDRVTAYDPNGKQVFSLDVVTDGASRPLTIPTAIAGAYRVTVMDMKLGYNLKAPADLRFCLASAFISIAPCPRLYFFVPKGIKRLALYAASAVPIELLDGDGKLVGDKANGLIVKDVPAGQDGKVWSLRGFKGWTPLLPLNFPAKFAYTPDALIVPNDALSDQPAQMK